MVEILRHGEIHVVIGEAPEIGHARAVPILEALPRIEFEIIRLLESIHVQ